ncbi:hypothetical protein HYC85_014370 [Camellia sinensis]|uniref:Uncharacterized protein n=1 Tax=Camellia sinensis TaxID=4442 RepID=A0A7J7H607_CAMSI|nr:hypothetical protein HYC85_014370 [Camellia sinensis]
MQPQNILSLITQSKRVGYQFQDCPSWASYASKLSNGNNAHFPFCFPTLW